MAEKFSSVGYKNVKKGGLARLWEKSNVLAARNILRAILAQESITLIRRKLKRATNVLVSPEEIIVAMRRLLNEAAIAEMETLNISISEKKQPKRKTTLKSSKEKEELRHGH